MTAISHHCHRRRGAWSKGPRAHSEGWTWPDMPIRKLPASPGKLNVHSWLCEIAASGPFSSVHLRIWGVLLLYPTSARVYGNLGLYRSFFSPQHNLHRYMTFTLLLWMPGSFVSPVGCNETNHTTGSLTSMAVKFQWSISGDQRTFPQTVFFF